MGSDGRRPPYFLGLDLGGTNIKAGVVDDSGRALASVSGATRAELGPEAGLDSLADVAGRAVEAGGVDWSEIAAVGLGSAGTLDTAGGRIVEATNLPLWNGFPVASRLEGRLGRPISLLNDANAAAFGEYWAGAGRNTTSLVLITLGTGIGCGVVESGRLLEGRHGLGGEYGHVTVQMDGGRLCSCGRSGHLEAYASATSLVRRAVEAPRARTGFDPPTGPGRRRPGRPGDRPMRLPGRPPVLEVDPGDGPLPGHRGVDGDALGRPRPDPVRRRHDRRRLGLPRGDPRGGEGSRPPGRLGPDPGRLRVARGGRRVHRGRGLGEEDVPRGISGDRARGPKVV